METDEDLAVWGQHENKLRLQEINGVTSEQELNRAQAAARARRKAKGLSAAQAAYWVLVGQRLERGEKLPFALRKR